MAALQPETTIRLRITGRVQGVGYREAMRAAAEQYGVHGWVRNRSDGSVEAEIQGPREAVDALMAWARHGPPAARVDTVTTQPVAPVSAPRYAGFERLPSV